MTQMGLGRVLINHPDSVASSVKAARWRVLRCSVFGTFVNYNKRETPSTRDLQKPYTSGFSESARQVCFGSRGPHAHSYSLGNRRDVRSRTICAVLQPCGSVRKREPEASLWTGASTGPALPNVSGFS